MIDLFTTELNSLTNDQCYSAIVDFARAQPNESNRHDFKSIWTNDALKSVAAFANTFGGLLIIGVEKNQNDVEAKMSGVPSPSELTTGIASAIATNISPTPSYDIKECHRPSETNRRFCIVRVRSGANLYLITKKDISPAWVRNADQTVRADAAQLRSLIEREGHPIDVANGILFDRAHQIFEDMIIGYGYEDIPAWFAGPWQRSATYFKVALVSAERKWIRLDVRDESKFATLIHEHYRRVQSNLGGVARDTANRSADFYEYRWYHKNLAHEGRWRITNQLDIAHATQINDATEWSLVDIVIYTILLLKLGAKWWKTFNYFGDGILSAELNVRSLHLHRGNANQFLSLFNPGEGEFGMRSGVLVLAEHAQRTESQAYVQINSATMLDDIPRIVTSIMNTLLRSLGHAVLWSEFEDNVRVMVQGQSGLRQER
jgi:schlafen family protein